MFLLKQLSLKRKDIKESQANYELFTDEQIFSKLGLSQQKRDVKRHSMI